MVTIAREGMAPKDTTLLAIEIALAVLTPGHSKCRHIFTQVRNHLMRIVSGLRLYKTRNVL
jgi:hypothetical protein